MSRLNEIDEVSFYQWGKELLQKYPEKLLYTFTGSEVLEFFNTQQTSKNHWSLSKTQHKHYKNSKDNLRENDAIVHVNFSKNYDNKHQHPIQSAYFGYQQFSLYKVVIYYQGRLKKIVIVTPDKAHSHIATYHLISYLLETTKTFIPNIEKVLFWSDGCASQFKSCFVFQDIAHLNSSITIDWNYFKSHHGKGAADGIGGCVKQKVFKHVKPSKVILSNAEQFTNYTNKVVQQSRFYLS